CSFKLLSCVGQPPTVGTVHNSRAPVMSLTKATVLPSGESRLSVTERTSESCSEVYAGRSARLGAAPSTRRNKTSLSAAPTSFTNRMNMVPSLLHPLLPWPRQQLEAWVIL